MAVPTASDWAKVGRFLRGEWPRRVPPSLVNPTKRELEEWCRFAEQAPFVVIDTEYNPETLYLTLVGLGYPGGPVVQLEWPHVWDGRKAVYAARLRALVGHVPVVFQNAFADIPVLAGNMAIAYGDYGRVDDLMLAHAVLWSELPHDLGFLASLYGEHPKMKHLAHIDPLRYNLGDVVDTVSAWEAVSRELAADPLSKRVYETQSLPLIPSLMESKRHGIRIDPAQVEPASRRLRARMDKALFTGHAYTGYPVNLGSDDQVAFWLYTVEGLPVQRHKETKRPTINRDALTELAQALGEDHPLIDARLDYADAQQDYTNFVVKALRDPGGPLDASNVLDRWYPNVAIHAQASGRHSTTDPPLSSLPGDLESLLVPDEGEAWIDYDWSNIEPLLLAALTGDTAEYEAIMAGHDLHTRNTCDAFGLAYPPVLSKPVEGRPENLVWMEHVGWQGEHDSRRRWTKALALALNYGKKPENAHRIPRTAEVGLTRQTAYQAALRYMSKRGKWSAWRQQVQADISSTRHPESRTFLGRRRRLLGGSEVAFREALNHPCQGGVSDIFNTTLLEIKRRLPGARYVRGQHDRQVWAVPIGEADEAQQVIREVAEQPWQINGREVRFPVTFKAIRRGVGG